MTKSKRKTRSSEQEGKEVDIDGISSSRWISSLAISLEIEPNKSTRNNERSTVSVLNFIDAEKSKLNITGRKTTTNTTDQMANLTASLMLRVEESYQSQEACDLS